MDSGLDNVHYVTCN